MMRRERGRESGGRPRYAHRAMTAARAATVLTWLLRLSGALALSAVVPMLMPTDWMAAANDRLGLEPLHRSPLTEYLTRSLSAVYTLFGALAIYVTLDLRRYLALVAFMGRLTVALGIFLTGLDFWAGLPAAWSWGEGPPTVVLGIVMVWLAARAGAESGPPAAGPRRR